MVPDPVKTLHQQMTELDDGQLADLITQVDAAEVIAHNKTPDMGASAAWYARVLSWPVFPCRPGGKHPSIPSAHPEGDPLRGKCHGECGRFGHGLYDATVDLEQIAAWWTRWPDANIGVPTGADGCGYDVVDVDGRDGNRAWAVLKHRGCPPGCCDVTFCPATGPFDIKAHSYTPGTPEKGLGQHLFIPATGKGNTTRLQGVSIDWRGAGGYVIVPPSTGPNGARYTWHVRPVAGE